MTKAAKSSKIRSYRYVSSDETGFYYLQSRYYDPAIGRFINADTFTSTGQGFLGYNMFSYCNNNPVNNVDLFGTFPVSYDPVVQAAIDFTISYVERLKEIEKAKQDSDGIYATQNSNGEIKIHNSFTETNWQEMYNYSKYLVEESEFAPYFSGSAEDVFVEWLVHNAFAYIPVFEFEKAKDTDVGSNIFADRRPALRAILAVTYYQLFPVQFEDNYLHSDKRNGG